MPDDEHNQFLVNALPPSGDRRGFRPPGQIGTHPAGKSPSGCPESFARTVSPGAILAVTGAGMVMVISRPSQAVRSLDGGEAGTFPGAATGKGGSGNGRFKIQRQPREDWPLRSKATSKGCRCSGQKSGAGRRRRGSVRGVAARVDDVSCKHRYVCWSCCRTASARRLSAYLETGGGRWQERATESCPGRVVALKLQLLSWTAFCHRFRSKMGLISCHSEPIPWHIVFISFGIYVLLIG
jgi:hypothetical protein